MVNKLSEKTIKQIKDLRKTGLSYSQISFKLGVLKESVIYYVNDEYRERYKKKHRELMKKNRRKQKWKKKNLLKK